ncbi:amidohydrolase [Streptomyces spiroverticillatus]
MPVAGISPTAAAASHPADLLIRNAKVFTGDPARPEARTVAVRDGRVLALGDDDHATAHLVGPATRVIDVLGRRVVPGLDDSHLHVIRGGLNYVLELRWDGVRSLRTALAMLREQAGRTPKGQWIRVVGGWSAEQFAERRMPTVAELNAAAPDTPVFVLHLYQSALLNRAAVRAAGYTRETPDPRGGQIVRGRDGEPTGVLLAAPGALLLYSTLAKAPALDAADRRTSTRHFLRELNRFGLTSALDAAGGSRTSPTTTPPSPTWPAPANSPCASPTTSPRRPQARSWPTCAAGRRPCAPATATPGCGSRARART